MSNSQENNVKSSCASCTNCACGNARQVPNLHKDLIVTMPDGSKWAVPVRVIAESHARHFAKHYEGDVDAAMKLRTAPLFDSDPAVIIDWAEGSMNWSEVAGWARLVAVAHDCDMQHGWVNGDKVLTPKTQAVKATDAA